MAIIESGTIGRLPSVDECLAHPSLYEVWGIENTSMMIVGGNKVDAVVVPPVSMGDMTIEFYRHPSLLVSDTIELWRTEYKTVMKYGAQLTNPDDLHPCFIEAGLIYDNYKGAFNGK